MVFNNSMVLFFITVLLGCGCLVSNDRPAAKTQTAIDPWREVLANSEETSEASCDHAGTILAATLSVDRLGPLLAEMKTAELLEDLMGGRTSSAPRYHAGASLVEILSIKAKSGYFAYFDSTLAKSRMPALIAAVLRGDEGKVKLLVKSSAALNEKDDYGYTALHYAARYGHLPTVQTLVRAGARVGETRKNSDRTPLDCAVSASKLPVIDYLVSEGATFGDQLAPASKIDRIKNEVLLGDLLGHVRWPTLESVVTK